MRISFKLKNSAQMHRALGMVNSTWDRFVPHRDLQYAIMQNLRLYLGFMGVTCVRTDD